VTTFIKEFYDDDKGELFKNSFGPRFSSGQSCIGLDRGKKYRGMEAS